MAGLPLLQLCRKALRLLCVQNPPIEEAQARLVVTVPSQLPDTVIAAELVENT